ncbi:hypothetical protein FF011L_24200 [Roseimaritima multifibrata]|uniref:Peptidase S9 prolyl oligopeptidase catalytic domain-containing protein n=1 Tax=Roseimaritima multifibrata TaxID=1930274 RepID=A0A517MFV7_9BACT|nr:prolyl oligopeptidase family serine peptidase [Roseimaritima multifibrata]QDS93647.1 hypothetical protein FF011L_24200 [Roseimaritima multifibrata]
MRPALPVPTTATCQKAPLSALRQIFFFLLAGLISCSTAAVAQDSGFPSLPKQGKLPAPEVVHELQDSIAKLRAAVDLLPPDSKDQSADIEVLIRSVDLAIQDHLFYRDSDAKSAAQILQTAKARLEALQAGATTARHTGLPTSPLEKPTSIVGGFVSKIDGSVQPYGLVLPAGWEAGPSEPRRLDVWLHGRGDSNVEMQFVRGRLNSAGPVTPDNTFVLHPFGRHCNAFKFAGEVDVYEAIQTVAAQYSIDPSKISIRGFSMGGAGCWQFAVHDPGMWFAANPGAGFADTVLYQGWDSKPAYPMTPYQIQLLNWYDCPPWAGNLANTNVLAYSGEIDKQKLAADTMVAASKKLGLEWLHIIGPGMGHKIDPNSADIMDKQLSEWAAEAEPAIPNVDFTTYFLRYPRCHWLTVNGLERHWSPGRVQGKVEGGTISIDATGVTHLAIDLPADQLPTDSEAITIRIGESGLAAPDAVAGKPYHCDLVFTPEGWSVAGAPDQSLRKRPGLQGPIDDAFTKPFLIVLPSRPCWHGSVERWVSAETEIAIKRWHDIMRGEARTVLDRDLDAEMIRDFNLVLFGDPHANRTLGGIIDRLPIVWTREQLVMNGKSYDPADHAAAMIYPNPLNPDRYVVLNSGLTFREFSNVSNSRQIPMLPDWAIIETSEEQGPLLPGTIPDAGFFDEKWKAKSN